MKLYKSTITPSSNFATSLKGDTLFGQFCWAYRYTFGKEKLESLLETYEDKPFLIISDAFIKKHLPKPNLPARFIQEESKVLATAESIKQRKENKKKIWLDIDDFLSGDFSKAKKAEAKKAELVIKNNIDYKDFKTKEGHDPFSLEEFTYTKQDIYFLLDEDKITLDELEQSFSTLANIGYGKKASTGKGRFSFSPFEPQDKLLKPSKTFMALSPFCPFEKDFDKLYYEPFIRFGKHGASLANKNPFKKPIVLADTASVFSFKEEKSISFIGKGLKGISSHKNTVHQAYAIVLGIKKELN